jgi:transcriptional regulator with XRE-family HTH domain
VVHSPLHYCLKQFILEYMDIRLRFGQRLKEIRISKGISQEKLAHLSGIDRTYIPDIEKGVRNVSLLTIERLALALKIKIKDLLDF